MSSEPRRRAAGALIGFGLALAIASFGRPACAEPAADPPAAQRLFERGLALLDAGDLERALEAFLESRALLPGKGNTANAAHCLHELGRFDEALELYEDLLSRFAGELSAENRRRLVPAMTDLRDRVASIEVSSNVEGAVVVDGRARGRLPLRGPLRVLPGTRVVRVVKDGYATFEAIVTLAAGKTSVLDAVLRPLAEAGQLRLEDPENPGAEVFVDRVRVGTLPWEGTLGPGDHLVWAATASRGSAPARAIVVQGQTATLRLRSRPLGAMVDVSADPSTAELRLDGVALGVGGYRGRLPVGTHEIAASEPGYVAGTMTVVVPAPDGAPVRAVLHLDVDPAHPRWPKRSVVRVAADAFGAFAAGPGLGGDAESWCARGCSTGPRELGGLIGARVGVRFAFGLFAEFVGGYLRLEEPLARSRAVSFTSAGVARALTYRLDDDLLVTGAFVGAGAGYRAHVARRLTLVSRLTAAVVLGGASDPITGTASTSAGIAPLIVTDRGERVTATIAVVEPELDLEVELGPIQLAAGVGLGAFLTSGPRYSHALLEVDPSGCSLTKPGSPSCAPASSLVAGEVAFRPFAAMMPTLSAGHAF